MHERAGSHKFGPGPQGLGGPGPQGLGLGPQGLGPRHGERDGGWDRDDPDDREYSEERMQCRGSTNGAGVCATSAACGMEGFAQFTPLELYQRVGAARRHSPETEEALSALALLEKQCRLLAQTDNGIGSAPATSSTSRTSNASTNSEGCTDHKKRTAAGGTSNGSTGSSGGSGKCASGEYGEPSGGHEKRCRAMFADGQGSDAEGQEEYGEDYEHEQSQNEHEYDEQEYDMCR